MIVIFNQYSSSIFLSDKQALFLVSTSKDAAQIYEIVCENPKDQKQ